MKLIAIFCLAGVCLTYTIEKNSQVADNAWVAWTGVHKKAYKNLEEERARYAIWKDNIEYIEEFNANNKHMSLDINHFGDLTHHEFRLVIPSNFLYVLKKAG